MRKNKIPGIGVILLFTGLLLSVVSASGKHPVMSSLHFTQGFFIGIGIALTLYGQIRRKWDGNAV